jgi:hypothetical protein
MRTCMTPGHGDRAARLYPGGDLCDQCAANAVAARSGAVQTRWIWVSLPDATFGIGVRDGLVVDAAPVARWCIGKGEREVAGWFRARGAQFQVARRCPARDPGLVSFFRCFS